MVGRIKNCKAGVRILHMVHYVYNTEYNTAKRGTHSQIFTTGVNPVKRRINAI